MSEVTPQEIEELQKISNYRLVHKGLRWPAIGSIIFGLIAVVSGVVSIEENPVNLVLALIGTFLFIEGIWLIVAPNPKGMIIDGIALLIIGIWNIITTMMNWAAGYTSGAFFYVLGFLQIIWGIQSFIQYRRFSRIPSQKPNEESIRRVDEIIKSVIKSQPSESENVVQFQTIERFRFFGKSWKGKLSGDVGIFTTLAGNEAIFARRDEAQFSQKGKSLSILSGKKVNVSMQIGNRKIQGIMSPEFFKRLESWKAGSVEQ
jgi:hypothetical protein